MEQPTVTVSYDQFVIRCVIFQRDKYSKLAGRSYLKVHYVHFVQIGRVLEFINPTDTKECHLKSVRDP